MSATKSGDHRTRLTHSLEVEQIAVSIADALNLNRDLVAAISLGHDVGHTPFGHAAERELDKKIKGKGGFSHAVQSVRYLKNSGIKLSYEVYEGILKHDTDIFAGSYNNNQYNCEKFKPDKAGSLEAQIVYWSDSIAYITHDFEDFYKSNTYNDKITHEPDFKEKLISIVFDMIIDKNKADRIRKNFEEEFKIRDLIRDIIGSLIIGSMENLESYEEKSPENARKKTDERIKLNLENGKNKKEAYQRGLLINFREDYLDTYKELRELLNNHYIRSPEIQRSDAKAKKIVSSLYDDFIENTDLLPLDIRDKIDDNGDIYNSKERIIVDYIATMTDQYAGKVYNNLNLIGQDYYL